MIIRGALRFACSMMSHIGPRYYSTIRPVAGNEAKNGVVTRASFNFLHENSIKDFEKTMMTRVRYFSTTNSCNTSIINLSDKEKNEQISQEKIDQNGDAEVKVTVLTSGGNNNNINNVSYWGIQPPKVTKEDGTPWKWNCFMVRKYYFYCIYVICEQLTYVYLIFNVI